MLRGIVARAFTLVMLVGVGTIAGYSSVASAYVYSGHKWPTNNTLYVFNSTMPDSWKTPTYNAAVTWNGAGAHWAFYNDPGASNTWGSANYGQYNGIIGITTVSYSGSTNQSVWSDFNTYYPWSSSGDPNSYDLQSSATHEFGHWLTLYHSTDTTAVMYASLVRGQSKRSLAQDDINGIKYIYP